MPRWSFRPAWWAVLGTLAGCALTLSLGVWQLHRGQAKQVLQTRYDTAALQPPLQLNGQLAAHADELRNATAVGRYLPDRQLLLDNQTHERQPGYDVWTPLRLRSGGLILVNRGWIADSGQRDTAADLPTPAGEVQLRGLWRSLPAPGLRMTAPACTAASSFPVIVNYPAVQELTCVLGEPVADGVLLLDPQAAGGYLREWKQVSSFPPQRHYAYAAQWFMFAATLLVIFISLNLKKREN